jgi:hypothetical protein
MRSQSIIAHVVSHLRPWCHHSRAHTETHHNERFGITGPSVYALLPDKTLMGFDPSPPSVRGAPRLGSVLTTWAWHRNYPLCLLSSHAYVRNLFRLRFSLQRHRTLLATIQHQRFALWLHSSGCDKVGIHPIRAEKISSPRMCVCV